jgi:uncharacterized phage-associated protein
MNIYRQKLLNTVLFFAKETKYLNLTKLMKLLNFFDFEHFKETGYPSIGLEYYAFAKGPVPKKFWLEIKDGVPPADLQDKVLISVKSWDFDKKVNAFIPKPKAQVDFTIFTRREKAILERLAFIYQDADAATMSEVSHEAERPWEITIKEKGLAIDEGSPINREEASENLHDIFEIMKAFDIEPA